MRSVTWILCLVGALLVVSPAWGHLMPQKQGTIHLVNQSAFVVLAVPVSALQGFDDNGDGLLDLGELKAHQADLRAEVDRRLVVADDRVAGETLALDFVLSPEHGGPTGRAPVVVVLKHATWDHVPTHVRLACDLFGSSAETEQLTVTGTRSRADGFDRDGGLRSDAAHDQPLVLPPPSPLPSSTTYGSAPSTCLAGPTTCSSAHGDHRRSEVSLLVSCGHGVHARAQRHARAAMLGYVRTLPAHRRASESP